MASLEFPIDLDRTNQTFDDSLSLQDLRKRYYSTADFDFKTIILTHLAQIRSREAFDLLVAIWQREQEPKLVLIQIDLLAHFPYQELAQLLADRLELESNSKIRQQIMATIIRTRHEKLVKDKFRDWMTKNPYQKEMIKSLGHVGNKIAVEILGELYFQKDNYQHQVKIIRTLGRCPHKKAVKILYRLYLENRNPKLKKQAFKNYLLHQAMNDGQVMIDYFDQIADLEDQKAILRKIISLNQKKCLNQLIDKIIDNPITQNNLAGDLLLVDKYDQSTLRRLLFMLNSDSQDNRSMFLSQLAKHRLIDPEIVIALKASIIRERDPLLVNQMKDLIG